MEDYKNRVRKCLITLKIIEDKKFSFEDNLISSHLIDSFSFIELIIELEDEFEIEFNPEDLIKEDFTTISTLTEKVIHYIKQKK